MATYDELVGDESDVTNIGIIRDWANRDAEVLSDAQVEQALRWAADKCYRKLRIPVLEISREFVVESTDFVSSEFYDSVHNRTNFVLMPVPQDLIDVVHIRSADGTVFNEKVDRRTFFDDLAYIRSSGFWTRLGNEYFIGGNFSEGDVLFIHYYRRLPALDATYLPLASTWNEDSSFFTISSNQNNINDTDTHSDGVLWFATGTSLAGAPTSTAADVRSVDNTKGIRVEGNEAAHWLRDENERILIFGALMEVFSFLNEPEQQAKYLSLFQEEIDELNREETMRRTKGGNVQVNFTSCLL